MNCPHYTGCEEFPQCGHDVSAVNDASWADAQPNTLDGTPALAPELDAYARELLAAGFTVYLPVATLRPRPVNGQTFFHYSRTVEGRECYGDVQLGDYPSLGQPLSHHMPIAPSRLNGSSAIIGGVWGDPETFNINNLDPASVDYARAVARPSNFCPYNAEPTREAVQRANAGQAVSKRYYNGATLENARPWGIGSTYMPATLDGSGNWEVSA